MQDDDDEYRPSSEDLAVANGKADELNAAAQKVGLYMQGYKLGGVMDTEGQHRLVIIADFVPGEVAWSTKVQDPEAARVDEEFRTIETVAGKDEYADYRAELAEDFEELPDGDD